MSEFADIAATILAERGEPITLTRGEADPATLCAVVTHHGRGYCPDGWDAELFPREAVHAEVRLAAEDEEGAPIAAPSRGDLITIGGVSHDVRKVLREPKTGPAPLWWICQCASMQGGKY